MKDSFATPSILQATVKKLSAREGVRGILVCDAEGMSLQTTLPSERAEAVSAHISSLVSKINSVKDELDQGELASIFIEGDKSEVIITPDFESGFTIVVLRDKKGA